MSAKGKVPVIALIIILLISISLAGAGFYLLQKERATNSALREELENNKMQQKIVATKLEESQKLVSDLELDLKDAQAQFNTLTADLEKEKITKKEVLLQVEDLKKSLEEQRKFKSDLQEKLIQTQKEHESLKVRLDQLTAEKADLNKKIKELEEQPKQSSAQPAQGVELGTIVVNPEGPSVEEPQPTIAQEEADTGKTSGSGLSGKVLVINKEYNFAVINLGSKDGVGVGDMFSVYHNEKNIGEVKVEKIHDSMSAAGFQSANLKDKINEGDKVEIKK